MNQGCSESASQDPDSKKGLGEPKITPLPESYPGNCGVRVDFGRGAARSGGFEGRDEIQQRMHGKGGIERLGVEPCGAEQQTDSHRGPRYPAALIKPRPHGFFFLTFPGTFTSLQP